MVTKCVFGKSPSKLYFYKTHTCSLKWHSGQLWEFNYWCNCSILSISVWNTYKRTLRFTQNSVSAKVVKKTYIMHIKLRENTSGLSDLIWKPTNKKMPGMNRKQEGTSVTPFTVKFAQKLQDDLFTAARW